MRIPLTGYAVKEILIFGGCGAVITAGVAGFAGPLWFLAMLPLLLTVWVLWFFRDPPRRPPDDPRLVLSAADGKVTDVETVEAPPELGGEGQALRISVFLSIFDCHINRAPCAGTVEAVARREGRHLNAMRAASAVENHQVAVLLRSEASGAPVLVRLIAGVIARRIVCRAQPGDRLAAGQRFGMIKFGSRTDVFVPMTAPIDVRVRVGDRVKAGRTVLGQFQ